MTKIFNPQKILKTLAKTNTSGNLKVNNGNIHWSIYFEKGQLKCAANSAQIMMMTLDYHLILNGYSDISKIVKSIPAVELDIQKKGNTWLEKGRIIPSIKWLIDGGHLEIEKVEKIFSSLTIEALETYLWLSSAKCTWKKDFNLPDYSLIPGMNLKPIPIEPEIEKLQRRIEAWQNLDSELYSPYQRLYLVDSSNISSSSPLLKLAKFLKGMSFRQLALILKQNEIKIAKLLFPYVRSGELVLREPQIPFNQLPKISQNEPLASIASEKQSTNNKKKIACIDDSPTILDEMQRFLSGEKFEVVKIEDPMKASLLLLKMKPDLILMDISMPNINGYKLCSFFRGSDTLSDVPIIMVSGRKGFIDKTRAKMSGATDYLTKPFSKEELLSIVDRYLCEVSAV